MTAAAMPAHLKPITENTSLRHSPDGCETDSFLTDAKNSRLRNAVFQLWAPGEMQPLLSRAQAQIMKGHQAGLLCRCYQRTPLDGP